MATLDITYDSPTSLSLTIDSTSNQLEITQVLARGAEGKGYDGVTSSTSLTISAATKAFSVNKQGAFVSGARIRLISAANPANWMEGVVTITDGTAWSLQADTVGGSGTYASWTVSLAGIPGSPGASGEANTASNLGSTGARIFSDKNGVDLRFRRVVAGTNVTVTENTNDITISATASGGEVNTASNLGSSGGRVFADKNGVDLRFRRIVAGTNVTVTENPNDLTIAATSDGSVTSVALSGTDGVSVSGSPITGAGTITLGLGDITPDSVAATGNVTGANLSGTNTGDQTITLSGDVSGSGTGSITATLANSGVTAATYGSSTQIPVIAIDAKGRVTSASNQSISVGEVNTASNLGVSGGRVFSDKSGTDLRFRRIVAGSNITVTENANDLTIASTTSGGEANTASNLGSTGARVFAEKSGVELRFRRLTAGTNITLTENANSIAIDADGGGVSAFADLVDVDFDPVADVGKTYVWNGFLMVPSARREVLTGDREYFVRLDGNDSNTGATNTAGGAFLTWQKAANVIGGLDIGVQNVLVRGQNGDYTGQGAVILQAPLGSGRVTFEGNTSNRTLVSLRQVISGSAFNFVIKDILIDGGSGSCVVVASRGQLGLDRCRVRCVLASGYVAKVSVQTGSLLLIANGIEVEGSTPGGANFLAQSSSTIFAQGETFTYVGSPNAIGFQAVGCSYIERGGAIDSGSRSGTLHQAEGRSAIRIPAFTYVLG